MDKTMIKGSTFHPIPDDHNATRPMRYDYWRMGYGSPPPPELDFCIIQAGEYHCKPNYATGNFDHTDHTQVFYQIAGEAALKYSSGRRTVSNGDMLVIPPQRSFLYSSQRGLKYHWFAVAGAWPRVFGAPGIHVLSPGYDSEIEAMLVEMREILILRKPGYPLRSVGVFYELMARVEEISGSSTTPESTYPESVRNAIIFLRENYAIPFNAAHTAAAVGLSQSHLRALFEKWLGESPKQFHTRCRINQARRLLSEQRLPVFEVAYHVGFTDAHHFSRVFKKMTGVAPSHYKVNRQIGG